MEKEKIRNELIAVFEETMNCKFRKKHYASDMEEMLEKHSAFLQETIEQCEKSEEMRDFVVSCIPEYALSRLREISSKRKRELAAFDYNLNMVAYFLPLLGEMESEIKEEFIRDITETWNKQIPDAKIAFSSYENIKKGFRRSVFCYITTAVCRSLGRPDDCYELNTLRDYRDSYLLSTDEGREMVQAYYNIAPTIVKRIDKKAEADEIYENIWKTYLSPCITMIENGENEKCRDLYSSMVRKLEARYLYLQED
ncbi:MAG: CFI-box-CTERM domain-containing protein [Mediterraneibacter sp.]